MDRSDSVSYLDSLPATSRRSPPSKLSGEKRSTSEPKGRLETSCKRIKTRDLDSVLRSEGTNTNPSESLKIKDDTVQVHFSKNEEISRSTEAQNMLSDRLEDVTTGQNDLLGPATCLSLGSISNNRSCRDPKTKSRPIDGFGCNAASSAYVGDNSKPSVPRKPNNGLDLNITTSSGLGVDLNGENTSNLVDQQNPFYPYKSLCKLKHRVPSECGSSTGPLEETEPLRMWKAMKQNGFLSYSHGGVPLPKQRVQSRKTKADSFKRKMQHAKREQVNRFTKIAAPSGLLSGLNPGIINHVRNSKQVHSIIEALVRSEKLENQNQNRPVGHLGKGSKDMEDRVPLDGPSIPSSSEHIGGVNQSHVAERSIRCEPSVGPPFTSECMDDMLTLKLSPIITTALENASCLCSEDFSANHESISSLSIKAATVASQWLNLLHQDISGRLAALRRSRKRVLATITTEFPSQMPYEFFSSQENDPCSAKSPGAEFSNNAAPDMHMARWRGLFDQMDRALSEEGKHLENWLRQVKEMQLHCERGLQFVNIPVTSGLQRLGLAEKDSRSKKLETLERECAVRAAAASIYSTCNLITAAENVSCF
ncbi:uncharacterized protein LOC131253598 [Magnolia sinica]|uniref:uncharacterized protein LOC131253598 n=1 Tax=Magnolia sinica TaxID=86752 RepID=UPI002658D5E2|nr:uncharacterized protein LOC131253598 [Magnolia sinica]